MKDLNLPTKIYSIHEKNNPRLWKRTKYQIKDDYWEMRVSCTIITARTLFMIFTGKNRESKRAEIESQVVERIRANKSFDVEINKAEFKRNNKKWEIGKKERIQQRSLAKIKETEWLIYIDSDRLSRRWIVQSLRPPLATDLPHPVIFFPLITFSPPTVWRNI